MRGARVAVACSLSLSLSLSLLWVLLANGALTEAQQIVSEQSTAEHSAAIIYVARRGWHIDIGFDAADLQAPRVSPSGSSWGAPWDSLLPEFPGVRYLFFGFGDEHYLLAKNHTTPVMLAALWPGRGMILATALKSPPSDAFGAAHVIALSVTRAELQAAEDFVQRSFGAGVGGTGVGGAGVDERAPIRPYARGPYDGSLYFIARDKYSAIHTCNTWAAQVLKAGGLRVHTIGVVFAGQLWTQVRRLRREQPLAAQTAHRASLLPHHRCIAAAACDQLQGGLVPS